MENLFETVKELQRERNNLEKTLQEQRQQCHNSEHKVEQVKEKYFQVQLKHKKASDSFAVAQHNVDLTHTSSVGLQEELDRSISKVDFLHQATEAEKKTQISQMQYFQTTLEQIATELFTAKYFYKKTTLNNEINNTMKELENTNRTWEICTNEIMKLEKFLVKLSQESAHVAGNKGLESVVNIILRAIERDVQEEKLLLTKTNIALKNLEVQLHCSPSKQQILKDLKNTPGSADNENITAISKLSIHS